MKRLYTAVMISTREEKIVAGALTKRRDWVRLKRYSVALSSSQSQISIQE